VAAGFAVVIAGVFGIYPPGFVAQVVAFAFGLAAASFFPVLVLGVFDTRTTKEGVIAGMLSGITFTAAYIIWFKFVRPEAGAEAWLFGISPEGIGTLGMLLNLVVTYGVSRLSPPPPEHVVRLVEEIRLPGGDVEGA
jgi:cation/acetate symporter